ncbi:MAG: hypothetical protein H7Y38_16585, partial [Armatimonadetes bacterium]|nr:hypothetical protein [Armatimonadota bacterium]
MPRFAGARGNEPPKRGRSIAGTMQEMTSPIAPDTTPTAPGAVRAGATGDWKRAALLVAIFV